MNTELRDELAAWCASYVTAFSAYDSSGVADHWLFPALITQEGRTLLFKDRDKFDANTRSLLSFYSKQGVARAERTLVEAMAMNEDNASMRVEDRMVREDGAVIVSWEAAYVLTRTRKGWRAVLAAADGEMDAWKARGTPLGRG
ncbi:MAG: hypothetical protein AAFW65_00750 [Pseudomonadota bacterium]